MRTTWKPLSNETTPLTFLLTLILSLTCLTSNSFGFSESALSQLWKTGNCLNCDLSGAFLIEKDLSGAELSWANLKGAVLGGANLTQANLTQANLTGVNLTGANLTHAKLRKANLTGVNLTKANLTGTIGIEKLPPSNTPQPSTDGDVSAVKIIIM